MIAGVQQRNCKSKQSAREVRSSTSGFRESSTAEKQWTEVVRLADASLSSMTTMGSVRDSISCIVDRSGLRLIDVYV